MRILLTGASGFIGCHVAAVLGSQGGEVRAFCRSEPPALAQVADWFQGDIRDAAALSRALSDCQAVVHAAGLYSYARSDAPRMHAVNLDGTRNVLRESVRAGVRRVLVTSSSATCGPVCGRSATEADNPPAWELNVPYKATKIAAERLALSVAGTGTDVLCVNPTTVVGAGDARPTPSGEDLPLREVFAVVLTEVGRPAPRWPVPWSAVYAFAVAADLACRAIGREPRLLVRDEVRLSRTPLYFSSYKARRELGYSPRPAATALADAARWFAAAGGNASKHGRRLGPVR